jgi:hypothetical protein
MTLIEIRPHRWSWKVFEAPGVEPVFLEKDLADACRPSLEQKQLKLPVPEQQIVGMVYDFALGGSQIRYLRAAS